jgi:hypothetical protein
MDWKLGSAPLIVVTACDGCHSPAFDCNLRRRPEMLSNSSRFISTTRAGPDHNHDACPLEFNGGRTVHHFATPISPKGGGRKVNIGGEGEAGYVGFEDFVTERLTFGGPLDRPLTSCLSAKSASDIFLRSAPITYPTVQEEIVRIARPRCRLTVASTYQTLLASWHFIGSVGTLLELVIVTSQPDKLCYFVAVVEMH